MSSCRATNAKEDIQSHIWVAGEHLAPPIPNMVFQADACPEHRESRPAQIVCGQAVANRLGTAITHVATIAAGVP